MPYSTMRTAPGLLALAVASALALAASPGPSAAATITVNTTTDENNFDGDCSLREAIRASNFDAFVDGCAAGSGADTIIIPAGLYVLSIAGAGEDDAGTGDLDINGELTVTTFSKSRPVILSNMDERAFHVLTPGVGGVVVFDHIEIRDSGVSTGSGSSGNGGAIYIGPPLDVEVLIDDCVFRGNEGLFGGAIQNDDGRVTIQHSAFYENTSLIGGGAIGTSGFNSSLLIEDTLFEANTDVATLYAVGGGFGGGGALFLERSATIRRSVFRDNTTAGGGGAIIVPHANFVEIEDSTFSGNHADLTGGALNCGDFDLVECPGTWVRSSTFTQNDAGTGGAIHANPGVPEIRIENTILAGNSATVESPDLHGSVWTEGHNLLGAADVLSFLVPISLPNPMTDLIGTVATPIDPLLGPLVHAGYALPFHRPLPGSPALDSGILAGPPFDQRGEPRGVDGYPDRGAIEQKLYTHRFYLDLGTSSSVAAATYGAAADLPGTWNEVPLGTTPLVDAQGAASGVTVDVASDLDFEVLFSLGTTPVEHLFEDQVWDCSAPAAWSVDFAGLPDGDYLAYVYAPSTTSYGITTGHLNLDLHSLPALAGDADALIEFQTWRAQAVTANAGQISLSGEDLPASGCAGVAGIQLLPEPGMGAALAAGVPALAALAGRRRARARGDASALEGRP